MPIKNRYSILEIEEPVEQSHAHLISATVVPRAPVTILKRPEGGTSEKKLGGGKTALNSPKKNTKKLSARLQADAPASVTQFF